VFDSRGEIDDCKQRFIAGATKILQPRPFVLKPARAAFETLQKHGSNEAYICRTPIAVAARWRSRAQAMESRTSPTGRRLQQAAALSDVIHFNTMNLLTLTEIRRATQNGATSARVHVQVESATRKLTREQQPYCELTLADACDRMTLRVWSDHPAYKTCSALTSQDFIELTADFYQSQYGLDARKWTVRPLDRAGKNELLQGPADLRAKQTADFQFVRETMTNIVDPRSTRFEQKAFSPNGATVSGAPRPRVITITPGAADWSSTQRK
jgi:hypothetical protein